MHGNQLTPTLSKINLMDVFLSIGGGIPYWYLKAIEVINITLNVVVKIYAITAPHARTIPVPESDNLGEFERTLENFHGEKTCLQVIQSPRDCQPPQIPVQYIVANVRTRYSCSGTDPRNIMVSHWWVRDMVVADGVVTIRCQSACKHFGDVGRWKHQERAVLCNW